MVLVDTSVLVTHFREGNAKLENLLNKGQVTCHRFIIGEIACGNIKNRTEILALLQLLPLATQAKHEEVMEFIETNKLMGKLICPPDPRTIYTRGPLAQLVRARS